MYTEIEIIDKIKCNQTKLALLLLFIEEYSGLLNHLNNVGLKWGSNGEEMAANKEALKTRYHIDL